MGATVVKRRKIAKHSTGTVKATTGVVASGNDNPNDIFRKFFESQFRPLDDTATKQTVQTSNLGEAKDDSEDEDFGGFSDEGSEDEGMDQSEDAEVMVVEHVDVRNEKVLLDKQTHKAIMSSRIPASIEPQSNTNKNPSKAKGEGIDNDTENLQNDLALQRLLKESHLLDSTSTDLNPTGKNRHKALDLRLQTLGAKKSIFDQKRMPKAHREGIQAKAIKTETTRRREARENGIILEKPVFKQQKSSVKRRDRGVGAPAVGKFSGGTLKLSKHDLASIHGPSRRSGKGGKGGKGSKRGRR